MARATSRTTSYDVQSPATGESRTLVERSYVKSTRVGNRYVTAKKEYALFDTKGRRYDRISDLVVECQATGERFHINGLADRIRKTP
jgi:hypothetical protein